jgi:hypothetical protein
LAGPLTKLAAVLTLLTSAASPGQGPQPRPADFKLKVAEFGLGREPVSTAEIVFRDGRAYVFPSDSKEVLIVEPKQRRIDLVDVGRRVQSEVSFAALEESLEKLRVALRRAAEEREKVGGRGNVLEAKMTRDLFETALTIVPGPDPGKLRLTNPAVEVEAMGDPDTDEARLAIIAEVLNSIARLGAYRTPNDLPPFAELAAIASLTGERRLRPTEISYLYRLAGPPKKFRRTYRFVPTLTDREGEAISRVTRLQESVPNLRYPRYLNPR